MDNNIKHIKVLAVEDDSFMRIFLKDVFWMHTHEPHCDMEFNVVGSLKEANEIIEKEETRPDIILLDLGLPEEDGGRPDVEAGFRFLEKIKSSPETKNIKVVVFSGFSDKEIKEKAIKLGADDFFIKGEYLPKELFKIIHDLSFK